MQNNVPIGQIIKQLRGIRCSNIISSVPQKGGAYLSCSDAIARTLMDRYKEITNKDIKLDADKHVVQSCPECGNVVIEEAGCRRCINVACGYKLC